MGKKGRGGRGRKGGKGRGGEGRGGGESTPAHCIQYDRVVCLCVYFMCFLAVISHEQCMYVACMTSASYDCPLLRCTVFVVQLM